jgi:DNA-binding GntR family transcriptional regulator
MPIPEQVQKFKRPLAREEVYTALQTWIVEGVYQPGETIRDQDLADALGVSRTPVREALQRLQDEGFVETATNRWTRVATLDLDEVRHLYPIIWTLEMLAISLAQPRLSTDDLDGMREANDRLREALTNKDAIAASKADYDFHLVFISQASNPDLMRMLHEVKIRLRWLEVVYFRELIVAIQSHKEHEAILDALEKGLYEQAAQAIKTNWEESLKRVLSDTAS